MRNGRPVLTPKFLPGQHVYWKHPDGPAGDGIIKETRATPEEVLHRVGYDWVDERLIYRIHIHFTEHHRAF